MIHQYKLGGYNIVLDVYSGSVHAVDDVAYDAIGLIDAGKTRAEAAVEQALSHITGFESLNVLHKTVTPLYNLELLLFYTFGTEKSRAFFRAATRRFVRARRSGCGAGGFRRFANCVQPSKIPA